MKHLFSIMFLEDSWNEDKLLSFFHTDSGPSHVPEALLFLHEAFSTGNIFFLLPEQRSVREEARRLFHLKISAALSPMFP